jgi:pimeloyl-ACP methyl ester carboxylesterase
MTAWQTGKIETNGIKLAYTRTGGDKLALVLAHGVTDNGLCWTPLATQLAPDYDVVMVDARGHGQSDAPATGYDPLTQANDLAGVIRGLGLERPRILGHSMGAVTTLVLAGTQPDLPGAILLEDPPSWWTEAGPAPTAETAQAEADHLAGMRAWFSSLSHKTRAELLAEQRAAAPSWSEAELAPWADSKRQVSPHVISVFDPQRPRAVDWPAVLSRISCPMLLLTADLARGAALGPEGITALQALVPQLQPVQIEGAGHNIRREQFDRFLAVVRSFLTS